MKVLLHNRTHTLWHGGDATAVAELEAHLRRSDVEAVYASDPQDMRLYDIIHLHNISMPWTWDQPRRELDERISKRRSACIAC